MKTPLPLFILLINLTVFATSAMGRDSVFLVGNNGQVVVAANEHRSGSGGRETDVTLVYGSHVLYGTFPEEESGSLVLKSIDPSAKLAVENKYLFKGSLSVDLEKMEMTLVGELFVAGEKESFAVYDSTFTCQSLED
jgi:hypothetical protein